MISKHDRERRSHVEAAIVYAERVVAGEIPACTYVVQACQRQLADLERWGDGDGDWPFVFDVKAAERVCRFIELLPHVKGEWAAKGRRIRLEPWQQFILTTVYGWKVAETGRRRFRTAYTEVPRKNAKSTLSSGLGLYMLALDAEIGAECYSAATKREQASIVFGDAQAMARRSSEFRLRYGVEVMANHIFVPGTGSVFRALDAEGKTLDGLNIHFAAVDELHAHRTRALFDVLETATGARSQSLMWLITTAGSDTSGICYEQRGYVERILSGDQVDETYFGIIYTIDEGVDWTSEAAWEQANPNLGVSVYTDQVARLCEKAKAVSSATNNFLTKHLNVWVSASSAWMDMRAWDACADPDLDEADFEGAPCDVAVDLASKIDIASAAKLFVRDDRFHIFWRNYLPQRQIDAGVNDQYAGWARDGHLIATPGTAVDYARIEDDIRADGQRHKLQELIFDPWQAFQMAQRLMAERFEVVEYRATVANFSDPMKELERLVLEGRLVHNGDPCVRWQASNVVGKLDAKDNIYPRKEAPERKIDAMVAAIMVLGRYLQREQPQDSVYLERGVIIL